MASQHRFSRVFVLHLGIVLKSVSCWVRKETRLFVCLFRWRQFPPWTENCIHFSLSLLGGLQCIWSAQSVGCMPSDALHGLTPLHLLAPHVVLSVQSDSSFDPSLLLLRGKRLDSLSKCTGRLSYRIWWIQYMKQQIGCADSSLQTQSFPILWGSLQVLLLLDLPLWSNKWIPKIIKIYRTMPVWLSTSWSSVEALCHRRTINTEVHWLQNGFGDTSSDIWRSPVRTHTSTKVVQQVITFSIMTPSLCIFNILIFCLLYFGCVQ